MLASKINASTASGTRDGKTPDVLKSSSGEDQKWDDDLSDGTPNGVDGVYQVEHASEPLIQETSSIKIGSSNAAPVAPSLKAPTMVLPPVLTAQDFDLETNAVASPAESVSRDSLDNSPSNKSVSESRGDCGSRISGGSPSIPSQSNAAPEPAVHSSSASPVQLRTSVPKLTKGVSFAPDERFAPALPPDSTLLSSVAAILDTGSNAKVVKSTESPQFSPGPGTPGSLSRSNSMNDAPSKVQQRPRTRPKLNAQLDLLRNSAVVERISPAQPPSYPSADDCVAVREASRRAALEELDATQGLAVDGLPWDRSKARRRDTEVLRAAALAHRSHPAVDAFAAIPKQADEARRKALAALQPSNNNSRSSYRDDVATLAAAARGYQERRRALKKGQQVLLLTRYRGPLPTLPPCGYSRAARAAEVNRLVQLAKLPRRKRKRLLPEERVALMVRKDKKRNLVRCAVPTPRWKVVQRVTEDGLCDAEYFGGMQEAAEANDLPLAAMEELLASGDLHESDYKYRFWRPLGLIWDELEREVEADRRQQNELMAKARKSTFSVDRARAALVSLKIHLRVGASATVRIAREVTSGEGSSSASSVSSSDEAEPAPPRITSTHEEEEALSVSPAAAPDEDAEAAALSLEVALYAAGSAAASTTGGSAKEALVAALAAAVAADSSGLNGSSSASAAAALAAALSGDDRRSSTARSSAVSDLTDASSVGGTARSSVASDISDVSSLGGGAYARLSSGPDAAPLQDSELRPSDDLPPSLRHRGAAHDHRLVVDRALFGDLLHPEACADVTAQVNAYLCAVGNASNVRLRLNVGGDSTVKSLAAAAAAAAADAELEREHRAARLSADAPPPRLLADALGLRPGAGQRLQPPTGGSAGYTQEAGLCLHLRVVSANEAHQSSSSSSNSSAESSPLFELRTPRAPGGGAAAVVAEVSADGHLRANWPLRAIQTSNPARSQSPPRHQSGILSGKAPPVATATPPRSVVASPSGSKAVSPASSKATSPSRRRGRPTPPPKRSAAPRRSAGRFEDTPTTSAQQTPGRSDNEEEAEEGGRRARKTGSREKGGDDDDEEKHMRMLLSMRQQSESHLLSSGGGGNGGNTSTVSVVGVMDVGGGGAEEQKFDHHHHDGASVAADSAGGWESGKSWASTEAVGAEEEDLGLSELDELRARMALRRNSRRDADLLETLARATATALEWEQAESNAVEVEVEVEEVTEEDEAQGKQVDHSLVVVENDEAGARSLPKPNTAEVPGATLPSPTPAPARRSMFGRRKKQSN
jgi:hypothetical protein